MIEMPLMRPAALLFRRRLSASKWSRATWATRRQACGDGSCSDEPLEVRPLRQPAPSIVARSGPSRKATGSVTVAPSASTEGGCRMRMSARGPARSSLRQTRDRRASEERRKNSGVMEVRWNTSLGTKTYKSTRFFGSARNSRPIIHDCRWYVPSRCWP